METIAHVQYSRLVLHNASDSIEQQHVNSLWDTL